MSKDPSSCHEMYQAIGANFIFLDHLHLLGELVNIVPTMHTFHEFHGIHFKADYTWKFRLMKRNSLPQWNFKHTTTGLADKLCQGSYINELVGL